VALPSACSWQWWYQALADSWWAYSERWPRSADQWEITNLTISFAFRMKMKAIDSWPGVLQDWEKAYFFFLLCCFYLFYSNKLYSNTDVQERLGWKPGLPQRGFCMWWLSVLSRGPRTIAKSTWSWFIVYCRVNNWDQVPNAVIQWVYRISPGSFGVCCWIPQLPHSYFCIQKDARLLLVKGHNEGYLIKPCAGIILRGILTC